MPVLFRPEDRRDPYLRRVQRVFDDLHLNRGYSELTPKEAKLRRIRHQIGRTGYRLAKLDRSNEPTTAKASLLSKEVVPDLLIYRTQIANTLRIDLAKCLEDIVPGVCSVARAIESVTIAGGALDCRIESLERGAEPSAEMRERIAAEAIPELHVAAVGLANAWRLGNPSDLHADRLKFLHRQPGMS